MLDLLPVLRVLGILLMVFALTMGLPLGVSWVQGDGVWRVYPVSMAVTMGVGLALWVGLRRGLAAAAFGGWICGSNRGGGPRRR